LIHVRYPSRLEQGPKVILDRSRNSRLTSFGIATLEDRYLLPGEDPQDMFARVAMRYADDTAHAQRMYDYISNLWFMPATPVLSNAVAPSAACPSPASSMKPATA